MINERSPLIGVLDSAQLSVESTASYLSATELEASSAIRDQGRRAEWLAGRIAAKFVFLERERSAAGNHYFELSLQEITRNLLAGFSEEAYRDVMVTKDQSPAGGPAQVGWRVGGDPVKAAISHVNGIACAFIGTSEIYSVDLEASVPRIPEFYTHNFTSGERGWTGDCARSFDLNRDWLYTLLWSAKECLLKTPAFASLSLWDMVSLEIDILAGSERLKAVHDASALSASFEYLRVQVVSGQRSGWPDRKPFQLAVSGTPDLILTAITRLD